jgi:Flp pilus assembly pilin Flp
MDVFSSFRNRLVVSAMGVMTGARREEGQTFVEYALILAVIAAGAVVALTFLSGQINALYGQIVADVPGV